jgi:hypothetical protein
MIIKCFISMDCESGPSLEANIKQALKAEGVEADVVVRRIDDEQAMSLGLTGSPSVFIDDRELQRQAAIGFS